MRATIALLLSLSLAAQQPPATAEKKPDKEYTFESSSTLVVVNVAAKDKSGNPLQGLKASDFTITEDGKPQHIRVFEYQSLSEAPLPAPELKTRTEEVVPPIKPVVGNRISPSSTAEIRYKDRRLMVLYFDLAGMPVADQYRAQQSALKYLNTNMSASDVVAVMTYATTLNVLQDFTSDRDRLTEVIRSIGVGETGMANGSTGDDSEADSGAAFTADDSEFNMFNTDRKLAGLESAVKMLRSLPEKKALVYFASGMSKTGIDNQAQLRGTINAAIRANVAFYPVDARGLIASAPMGDATKGSPGGRGMFTGDSQRSARNNLQAQQDSLVTLAADTGGKALIDQNDLSVGITQAQRDISSYYILGYYSTNTANDGRYRRIKVEVAKTLNAKLDYRSGYFASKEFRQFNSSDRELQLQEALSLGDPVTDISLALEVNYFRLGRDRYFVPVAIKIPGSDIELAKKGGAEQTRLDFLGEVRDAKGTVQASVRDELTVKLKGDQIGQLSNRNLQYDTGFTLQPGAYKLKVLARENETGKMGTFETNFTVPDLGAEQRQLPISSVVLSNQREKLSDALASAEKNRKLLRANPLVQDDTKLVPSVTRVFRKQQEMYVYLEAYQPAATQTETMVASVSFFRGKVKAFETAPVQITSGLNEKSKAVPVRFSVPLAELQPGRYTCQVNVLNPGAQKFAVWRSPMVVLP